MLAATSSTCIAVRAATTTCAPARAMASAVARPIPFPAPVITATRPLSQFGESATGFCPGPGSDLVVEAVVGRNRCLEIQVRLGVPPAIRPTDHRHLSDTLRGTGDIICWHEKTRLPVTDDLGKGATIIGNHRSPGRLRLGGRHPERLFPPLWTKDRAGASHELPDLAAWPTAMDRDIWLAAMTVDRVASILRVVRLAIEVDRNICLSGDRDGMGGPFFRAEPAGKKQMAAPGLGPRNLIYRHAVGQHDVDPRKPSPPGCRGLRDGRNCRWIRRSRCLVKGSRHRGVGR